MPTKESYHTKEGETVIPDIKCHAQCNPECFSQVVFIYIFIYKNYIGIFIKISFIYIFR